MRKVHGTATAQLFPHFHGKSRKCLECLMK